MSEIDTKNCETEPIRFPGSVQPHGVLLVLQAGIIEAASASAETHLGLDAKSLLGQPLHKIFGTALESTMQAVQFDGQLIPFTLNAKNFIARPVHRDNGQILLDIEPGYAAMQIQYQCRRDIAALRSLTDVAGISHLAANLLRDMTGFDRVMIYRFDAAWNGEVIAEACAAHVEPYLGLNFPASDIPKQARDLFQSSKIRLIPDVRFTPSALLARCDLAPIDLGGSDLRSVSHLHIKYLNNMEVRATLVGSLLVEGRLWGLVSCQHKNDAKYFCPEQRDALGWFFADISAHIEATLIRQTLERENQLALLRRNLVNTARDIDIRVLMHQGMNSELLAVVGADGFALLVEDTIQCTGKTPDPASIRELQKNRQKLDGNPDLYASNALSRDLGLKDDGNGVAGALFISASRQPNISMIWFRTERQHTVRWGGDPEQAHVTDKSGRLSPRKSFAEFIMNVRGESLDWSAEELDSASEFGSLIGVEEQRKIQALLQTIFDSVPMSMAVLDAKGIIKAVNSSWKQFPQDHEAGSLGLNYLDICALTVDQPAEAAQVLKGIEGVLHRNLDNFTLDYRCDTASEQHWFNVLVCPMLEPFNGAVLVHQNITKQKQMVEALRLSEQRWKYALEGAGDGVWEWNISTDEILFSRQWKEMIGYCELEFPNTRAALKAHLHPDDHDRVLGALKAYLESKLQYYEAEFRLRCKDDSWKWISSRGMLISHDAEGKPLQMIGVHSDITKRKQAEICMAEAQHAADSANIAKSQFLAAMSHELRTPLNGILGMAQILEQHGIAEADRLSYAKTILNSGNHLLALLNGILDLSKIEAGKIDLEEIAYIPALIINEVKSIFSKAAADKGLQLKSSLQLPHGLQYLGDPHRLRQMLSNLVNNAIKFTPQGHILIEGRELTRNNDSAVLEFSVSDTGIGIAQDKFTALFKPFSQVNSSITRQYGGTGLGLSIVQKLAQQMGGEAGVTSEPGKGSRFCFSIRATTLASNGGGEKPVERSAFNLKKLSGRVLLVDDSETNRIVIAAMLKPSAIELILAENGLLAVDRVIRGEPFDLVLMDVQMPVMNGYEATRQIRLWEADRRRLPIIALTADAYAEDRQRCFEAGMDDFMAKPIYIDRLTEILAHWLAPVSTHTAPTAIFDEEAVLAQLAHNRALALTVVLASRREMAADFDQLIQAVEGSDRESSRRLVHTLKALAAQAGGTALTQALKVLDQNLKAGGNLDSALLSDLQEKYRSLDALLQVWITAQNE
jgi:PAS domain S-box-containing protein